MTRARLIDHLLSEPSAPLAWADRTDEGWEPLNSRPRRRRARLLAAIAAALLAIFEPSPLA